MAGRLECAGWGIGYLLQGCAPDTRRGVDGDGVVDESDTTWENPTHQRAAAAIVDVVFGAPIRSAVGPQVPQADG